MIKIRYHQISQQIGKHIQQIRQVRLHHGPDGERVTVLSSRPADEITQQWGDIANLTVVNSSEPAGAAERLTVDVTLHLLREYAGTAHLLHAAVVGDASSHRAMVAFGCVPADDRRRSSVCLCVRRAAWGRNVASESHSSM